MEFFVTAFLIVLHTLFWGAGLAWWIMPSPNASAHANPSRPS